MPKGYKSYHTVETRKKISKSVKKAHQGNKIFGFQKGHTISKNRILSEEHKRKIGETLKGISKSKEHNKKNSEAHKGKKRKPFSEEWKKKLGLATKGKTYEEIYGVEANIQRTKRSEAHKGNKSFLWKGGISFEPYSLDWTKTLKKSIRERDKYICKVCGKKQEYKNHPVHHIDYDKKNCNPINLITLCHSCHSKTNFNRKYWIEYFNKK